MPPLSCPDCQQVITNQTCPGCGRHFAPVDGVINGLPHALGSDAFKDTEQRFWNFAYDSGPGVDHAPGYLEFHEHFLAPLKALGADTLVLEIAGGTRADGLRLLTAGVNVVETDISPIALSKVAQRYMLSLRGAPATWQSHNQTPMRSLDSARDDNSNYKLPVTDYPSRLGRSEADELRITDYGLPIFIAADAEHLPFPDKTFDGVFVAASFHHLPNPARGLREMARVTKPGGLVIVAIEPNHWPYKFIYKPLRPIKRWIRARRQRPVDSVADDTTQGFRKRDLIKLFQDANLEIIAIRPVKFLLEFLDSGTRLLSLLARRPLTPPDWLQRPLARFDYWLGKIPLLEYACWHWTIIGKKK